MDNTTCGRLICGYVDILSTRLHLLVRGGSIQCYGVCSMSLQAAPYALCTDRHVDASSAAMVNLLGLF